MALKSYHLALQLLPHRVGKPLLNTGGVNYVDNTYYTVFVGQLWYYYLLLSTSWFPTTIAKLPRPGCAHWNIQLLLWHGKPQEQSVMLWQ